MTIITRSKKKATIETEKKQSEEQQTSMSNNKRKQQHRKKPILIFKLAKTKAPSDEEQDDDDDDDDFSEEEEELEDEEFEIPPEIENNKKLNRKAQKIMDYIQDHTVQLQDILNSPMRMKHKSELFELYFIFENSLLNSEERMELRKVFPHRASHELL